MVIPYDQLNGIHSLTAILTEAAKYESDHGNATFVRPVRLPLYDKNIADNATTVVRVCAEAAHKSRLNDYASYKAAKRGVAKFLRDVVDEIWYNDLKDAETFYTKVTAIEIMALLDANSGGLHAVDMISPH
jgi:tRNA(Leu) C34 or U34 (ribose-2'-O)-methylase TrmL